MFLLTTHDSMFRKTESAGDYHTGNFDHLGSFHKIVDREDLRPLDYTMRIADKS